MELKTYLKQSKILQLHFSAQIGIHYMYLNKIINHTRIPSPRLALRIQEATGGAVTVLELLYPNNLSRRVA